VIYVGSFLKNTSTSPKYLMSVSPLAGKKGGGTTIRKQNMMAQLDEE